ncbi:MAG: Hydroxypyruvate isomerase [Verrucomicrobiales bacterium]|nr:Hydroxypyruvate isomerase [Verrucomicrobiales bacterium]
MKKSLFNPAPAALLFSAVVFLFSCASSHKDSAGQWRTLFDGKTLSGWHSFKKTTPPDKGWVVEDGTLHHLPGGGGGDLISDGEFLNFQLEWDWKVPKGANSGLKYLVSETREGGPLGHEYQLIDDENHADAKRGEKWQTAAFYDVIPAHGRKVNPVGQWNHSGVVIKGNHVEHWLNGVNVLEYELGSKEVMDAVAKSKFKGVKEFGTHFAAHFLLQDHHDEIWFKNIRVKEFKGQ